MKLTLIRITFGKKSTIGRLYINNKYFCYTLEDTVRPKGVKVYGKTAIPAGIYKIIVNVSPKFKKKFPRLLNVPMFSGILMHGGKTAEHTEGCILVGYELMSEDRIDKSASDDLTKILDESKEEHEIEIINYAEALEEFESDLRD